MPALEDIIYLDYEEDVGAEADLSNLETNISVSPILTTRVYKDHLVTQIISDLTSAPQTRSMARMVKEQEEVYVCQPPRFEDLDYLDKVYKVVKALYGLHQAPRAWYETLANYLLENGDIIFRSTNKELCKAFERLMKDNFQMSSMGELTFFKGLQVNQKDDGIFIRQDKYVAKILRKFGFTDVKSASTPIETEKPLLKDPDSEDVDVDCSGLRIDGKNVVVTEDVIQQDLRLDNADGVECLPNQEIFTELARMVYERPPPKLTFYKAVRKGFSRVEAPLFASMLVQPQAAEVEEEVEVPTAPAPPSPTSAALPPPQDPTPTPHASLSSPTQ
nr:hypothetical protein [Tanacetum cinerariifolium]